MEVTAETEASALGAAICAGAGAGVFRDLEEGAEIAEEELDGLPLEPVPEPPLRIQDRARARAERSVVEKDHVGAEKKEIAQSRVWVGRHRFD